MDVNELLIPCLEGGECGPALDYDAEFTQLELLALGKSEAQYGDVVISAEEPDWRAIVNLAKKLFVRTKDLRIAAILARGWVKLHGGEGLARSLDLFRGLLERYWESVHPLIEQDGYADQLPRAMAISVLADPLGVLLDLRTAKFLDTDGVQVSYRDAEQALSTSAGADATGLNEQQLLRLAAASLLAIGPDGRFPVERSVISAKAIDAICKERFDAQTGPSLKPLLALLELFDGYLRRARSAISGDASPLDEGASVMTETLTDAVGVADFGRGAGGYGRKQAVDALMRACQYFESNEPSSPVPVFLRRAIRLSDMRFEEIVHEMGPDSISTLRTIEGTASSS